MSEREGSVSERECESDSRDRLMCVSDVLMIVRPKLD